MKKKPQKESLTIKEQKFVKEVVQHGNATQATIDAGYNVKNREVAKVTAHRLMKTPKIQNEIHRIMNELYPDLDTTTTRRLAELTEAPVKMGEKDYGISAGDLLKTIQYVHKLKGYEPVTKKAVAHAHVHSKLDLPGEDGE